MVSLSDIAREVNLNISVVSRALNPNPDRHAVVKAETRERIREVARRMGYVPNRAASFCGRKSSATIFCFLPETADRLTADLMFGIVHAAGQENFPVKFFRGSSSDDFGRFLQAIRQQEHSGLITYPPLALGREMQQMLGQYHENRRTILMLNAMTNTGTDGLEQEFCDIPQLLQKSLESRQIFLRQHHLPGIGPTLGADGICLKPNKAYTAFCGPSVFFDGQLAGAAVKIAVAALHGLQNHPVLQSFRAKGKGIFQHNDTRS